MSEELKNLLITVLSGVAVYVVSQWFTEFILRPIQAYKELKAKVAKYLVLYACYYSNPQENKRSEVFPAWKSAADFTRELAAEVAAFAEIKPRKVLTLRSIPSKKKLTEASTYLIGLSNSYFAEERNIYEAITHSREYVLIIRKNLGISKK